MTAPLGQIMDKIFCIFGDSVSQAAYVRVGWVDLLRQYLEDKYSDDNVSVFNLGIGGNTAKDILKRFNGEALSRNPTSVIFAVGINDTKSTNPKEFKTNLEKLVRLAKEFSPEITFVGLVLGNWAGNEPFSQEKTTEYNKILKQIADLNGCSFIGLQEKLKPENFMDGLHPNEQGHRRMFEIIKKYY